VISTGNSQHFVQLNISRVSLKKKGGRTGRRSEVSTSEKGVCGSLFLPDTQEGMGNSETSRKGLKGGSLNDGREKNDIERQHDIKGEVR